MPRFAHKIPARTVLLVCVGLIVLISGQAWAQYRDPIDAAPLPDENPTTMRSSSYRYNTVDGNFQVTWPSGCGELRIRYNDAVDYVGEEENAVILLHNVACDQFGAEGEGCSVTAVFDDHAADGSAAGPDQVLRRVRLALDAFGVKIVKQMPVKREFAGGLVVEGVDIQGTDADGNGQFWVRGLLASPDIYLLTAWSAKGQMWENPEFQEFFNDFLPFAE